MESPLYAEDDRIATFDITKQDCQDALLRHWENAYRESTAIDLNVRAMCLFAAIGTFGAIALYLWSEAHLLTVVTAAVGGYFIHASLTANRTFRLRRRLADEYWDASRVLGVHVEMFWIKDGLLFRRGDVQNVVRWIDVTQMFITLDNRLWVCSIGDHVFWVPARAFPTPDALRVFAQDADARRESATPTGTGFEVIPAPTREKA